jgi:hypothetical protein
MRILHWLRSSASSYNFHYPFLSLSSFSICLYLLLRLPVPSISLSITCFRNLFLRKVWSFQLAFLCFILRGMFLYEAMCVQNGGENKSVPVRNIVPLFHIKTNYITNCDFTHAQLNVTILILMIIMLIIIIIIIKSQLFYIHIPWNQTIWLHIQV